MAGPFSVPALPTQTLLPERSKSFQASKCLQTLPLPCNALFACSPPDHQLLLLFPLWDPQKKSPNTGSPLGRAFCWDSATGSLGAPSASAMSSFPLACEIPQKSLLGISEAWLKVQHTKGIFRPTQLPKTPSSLRTNTRDVVQSNPGCFVLSQENEGPGRMRECYDHTAR